jgi:hypothetical protein
MRVQTENLDRIETLARIGSSLAGVQFEAASIQPSDLTDDPWVFGYCFGMLESMAQYARLDQYTEGVRMMANAFGKLAADESLGMTLFGQAVDLQADETFLDGSRVGSADLTTWAADANALPTALARHLAGRAKH